MPVVIPTVGAPSSWDGTEAPTIAHLAFPMQMVIINGQIQALSTEQDSLDDVFACVRAIASCPVGADPNDPMFGVPDLAFTQAPVNAQGVQQAIFRQEPRAVTVAQEYPDATSDAIRHVQIDVSTQQTDQ